MRRKIDHIEGAVYERNYVYNIHYHLIWATKYRQKVFVTRELSEEMKALLQEAADGNEIRIEEMEVMPDHVHLLVGFKPKHAAATVVKILKGVSARRFFDRHPEIEKQKLWGGHLWSHSYYIGTLGNMSREVVEKYIQNQYSKEKQE